MTDGINKAFSHLETILRHIASGFVFIILVVLLEVNFEFLGFTCNPLTTIPKKYYLIVFIGISILVGLTIYILHSNIFNPLFTGLLCLSICKKLCKSNCKPFKHCKMPSDLKDCSLRELFYQLTKRRWICRGLKDVKAHFIQNQMNSWGAAINYLFCSGYAVFLAWLFCWLDPVIQNTYLFWVGLFLFLFGLISYIRFTLYELRFWNEVPIT